MAGADADITATASTHEMVRSLVGAGIGCSILNMLPSTAVTYGGDTVTAVPLKSGARPLTLALGHLSGKPRRLVEAFMDAIQSYFANAAAREHYRTGHIRRRGDPGLSRRSGIGSAVASGAPPRPCPFAPGPATLSAPQRDPECAHVQNRSQTRRTRPHPARPDPGARGHGPAVLLGAGTGQPGLCLRSCRAQSGRFGRRSLRQGRCGDNGRTGLRGRTAHGPRHSRRPSSARSAISTGSPPGFGCSAWSTPHPASTASRW